MTDYFVASGGSNTSPYETWAKAATSLATALAAATTAGDRVIIQYDAVPSGDAELAADTVYTVADGVSVISSTNSGTSTITPTAMGAANWIGNSSTNRSVSIDTAGKSYLFGLTLRTAGSGGDFCRIGGSDNIQIDADSLYLWSGTTTATASYVGLGSSTTARQSCVRLSNSTFRFGHVGQSVLVRANVELINCTLTADGTIPTGGLFGTSAGYPERFVASGCNFSALGANPLVGDDTANPSLWIFSNCRLGASYSILAAQTVANLSSAEAFLYNCHSGDEHIHMAHHSALGETTIATGIYANDNICDSNLSWKIVGTTNATVVHPYTSPWIDVYHAGTSAITPSLECVRSGSATAYNNDEVWSQWSYQGTSGYTLAVLVDDRRALVGSAAAQTTGALDASGWTGENATSWFGKLAPTASFTPAEAGHIRARVCVAGANTVYVDPQIRGLS